MISYNLRLLFATSRWVAPAVFMTFWRGLLLSPPPPSLEGAAFLFPVVVISATWLTVTMGNLDDKPHRELLAAAAGVWCPCTCIVPPLRLWSSPVTAWCSWARSSCSPGRSV